MNSRGLTGSAARRFIGWLLEPSEGLGADDIVGDEIVIIDDSCDDRAEAEAILRAAGEDPEEIGAFFREAAAKMDFDKTAENSDGKLVSGSDPIGTYLRGTEKLDYIDPPDAAGNDADPTDWLNGRKCHPWNTSGKHPIWTGAPYAGPIVPLLVSHQPPVGTPTRSEAEAILRNEGEDVDKMKVEIRSLVCEFKQRERERPVVSFDRHAVALSEVRLGISELAAAGVSEEDLAPVLVELWKLERFFDRMQERTRRLLDAIPPFRENFDTIRRYRLIPAIDSHVSQVFIDRYKTGERVLSERERRVRERISGLGGDVHKDQSHDGAERHTRATR